MTNEDSGRAVPVVLPVIRIDDVCGGSEFVLTADIGDAESPRGERITGDQLGQRIAELVRAAGTSVRLEVHDADGTVHADILDPTSLSDRHRPATAGDEPAAEAPEALEQPVPVAGTSRAEQLWISESGWESGESVMICVALATRHAGPDGVLQAQIRLDEWPQLGGKVVLVRSSSVPVRALLPPRS